MQRLRQRRLQLHLARADRFTGGPAKCRAKLGADSAAGKSSGFEAGLLTRTSSTGSIMPMPKKWPQTILPRLVAKYGFSGDASQRAMISRRSLPAVSGAMPPRNLGFITPPLTG